ncbi:MAG: hypothetical protein N2517_02415, partial [Ignavibacteria bacterium]|nr:hypothetical protein [Ignavibacteria bacterium]
MSLSTTKRLLQIFSSLAIVFSLSFSLSYSQEGFKHSQNIKSIIDNGSAKNSLFEASKFNSNLKPEGQTLNRQFF